MNWTILYLKRNLGNFFHTTFLKDSDLSLKGGPGLPYKFHPKIKTKADIITTYPNIEKQSLELGAAVGWHMEPYFQWDCFPKVEILTKEKANRKTRLICGAPMELCLMGSFVSDSLNRAINENPLLVKSAVGLSMNRGGWDYLSEYLGGISAIVDESDAKQWDSSMSPKWLYLVYRVRRSLMNMDEDENDIFWFFFCELVKSFFVMSNGETYIVNGGNKSGSPNTCHDNTIGHLILVAYCFHRGGKRYSDFANFHCALFGDDFISERVFAGFWNYYQEFGVILGTLKQGPLECASFLSFRFLQTPYGVMPYHCNSKMLFSAFNHDFKKWRSVREQKLFVLYILNYWHCDSVIYRKILDILGIEIDHQSILQFWSGLLQGGGGFKKTYDFDLKCLEKDLLQQILQPSRLLKIKIARNNAN